MEPVNAKRVNRGPGEPSPHREPTDLRRTFARNLRQAREAAGLSRFALAKAAFSDAGLLGRIEVHATNVTLDTVERLTKSLGFTTIDLLLPNIEEAIQLGVRADPRRELPSKTAIELRRTFARNLREIRLTVGMQQKMLAHATSMTLTRISKIEVHATNVTLDTVTLLANHLGCVELDLLRPKDD